MQKFWSVIVIVCLSLSANWKCHAQSDRTESIHRTWRDSSGVFVLPATLAELSPTHVRLLTEDGSTIQLDRLKLSQNDQQYLALFEKSRNPFQEIGNNTTGGESSESQSIMGKSANETDRQSSIIEANTVFWEGYKGSSAKLLNMGSDKLLYSPYLALKPFRCQPLPQRSIPVGVANMPALTYDSIEGFGSVNMFRVDSTGATVMLNVRQRMQARTRPGYSVIVVGDLPNGPFRVVLESETEFTVLDHNERTGYSLVLNSNGDAPDQRELIVFNHLTDERIEVIGRYRLPESATREVGKWCNARLLDDNKILISDAQGVTCWKVPSGEFLYHAPHDRSNDPAAIFSKDRTVWALKDKQGAHFINSATGKSLGYLKSENDGAGFHVVFAASGEQVALVTENKLTILETTTGEYTSKELNAKYDYSKSFAWEHPRLMINRSGLVIDTILGTQITQYKLDAMDSVFWDGTMSFVMTQPSLRVQTLPFPTASLIKTLDELAENNELITVPGGTEVLFEFEYPKSILSHEEYDEIRQLFQSRIEAAGWKIVPKSPMSFRLTFENPQTALALATAQRVGVLPMETSPGVQPQAQQNATSDFPSFVARLAFVENDDFLWAYSIRYYVPAKSSNQAMRAIFGERDHISQIQRLKVPKQIFNPKLTIRMKASMPTLDGWQEDQTSTVNLSFFDSQ